MGGRIAQRAEWIHGTERFLASPFQTAIDALRLVDDYDRPRRLDQVDWLLPAGLLAILVEVVHVSLVNSADRHQHDLNVRAGGKVAHLSELGRIIKEIVEGLAGIKPFEMLFGNLKRLVDALLDRHRWHH